MRSSKLTILSVITAIGASLCCTVPVFAILAGIGGATSSFSRVAPARPYLAAFSILVISIAWYRSIKGSHRQTDQCGCEIEKASFLQSKTFLIIMTFFIALSLAFPYVAGFVLPEYQNVSAKNQTTVQKAYWKISGMTCESCELHIYESVKPLPGIISCKASFEGSNAHIEFDSMEVSLSRITDALNTTGYSATLISNTQ